MQAYWSYHDAVSLARAWTRQLYGASGAALMVPGAIVCALVVLALAGGFGALGSLGQAFAGPSVPASSRIAGVPGSPRSARALPVAAAGAAVATRAPVTTGGGGAPAVTPSSPAGQRIGSTGPGRGTGMSGGSGSRTGPPTGGGGSGGGASGGGAGPAGGGSSLVDNVVNLGTSLTNKIPGPVGGLATQLLQSLAKTVDGVIPQAARPAPSSPVTGLVKSVTNALHLP
jgi:hypothetical protein